MPGYAPGMFHFQRATCLLSLFVLASCRTPLELKPRLDPAQFDFQKFAAERPIPKGESLRADEMFRTAANSYALVQVEGGFPALYHKDHDELVWVVEGEGVLKLAEEEYTLKPAQMVFIPRGVVHSFQVKGSKRCLAVAVFSPAFDGKDQILVK